jgi:hypothetical protein
MELTKEYFDEQLQRLATKQDLEGVVKEEELVRIRADVAGLKDEVSGIKTNVIALQDDVRAVRFETGEIKETVIRIDRRDVEDSNVFAKDIVQLQKDVKELKLKHAS